MSNAPQPVLVATMETIHWATVFCRNLTLRDSPDCRAQVNGVMEAIHEIPRFMSDWNDTRLEEIQTHLGCFQSSRWEGAPDLVQFFNQRLEAMENE
jgi:hypothetical protein